MGLWRPGCREGDRWLGEQVHFHPGASLTTPTPRVKPCLRLYSQRGQCFPSRARGRLCSYQSSPREITSLVKAGIMSCSSYYPFCPAQDLPPSWRPSGACELNCTGPSAASSQLQLADGKIPLQVVLDLTGAHVEGLLLCKAFEGLIYY